MVCEPVLDGEERLPLAGRSKHLGVAGIRFSQTCNILYSTKLFVLMCRRWRRIRISSKIQEAALDQVSLSTFGIQLQNGSRSMGLKLLFVCGLALLEKGWNFCDVDQ
jgi:hypothetical protein